jgi:hypothetical protein
MHHDKASSNEVDWNAVLMSLAQPHWLKTARLYHEFIEFEQSRIKRDTSLEEQDRLWGNLTLAINVLVARGELETQGDISRPRHSELRLSPRLNRAD